MLYPSFQSLSLLQAAPSTRQRIQPSAPGEINFGLLSCCVPSFLLFDSSGTALRNCIRWRAIFKLPCHFRNYVHVDGRHPSAPYALSAAYRSIRVDFVCCCQSSRCFATLPGDVTFRGSCWFATVPIKSAASWI